MKVGDLVQLVDTIENEEKIGVIVRIDPDWMRAWSNVWVLWRGESTPTQHTQRSVAPIS